jgi:hypothetical protein
MSTLKTQLKWLLAGVTAGLMSQGAAASTLTTLYTFTGGSDGAYPIGGLIEGAKGVLYGTTALAGGTGCGVGCGTIFQMTPPSGGSGWTFSVIYTFAGQGDGQQPINLVLGTGGVIYGVAEYGGYSSCTVGGVLLGCGQVFALTPPAQGATAWKLTTLHQFGGGADGAFPAYGLTRDAKGDLFGMAFGGGSCGTGACGTVFELAPAGQNAWAFNVLHGFSGGADGAAPYGTPLLDAAGNLYGTTSIGGTSTHPVCVAAGGCGTVWRLAPPSGGQTAWSKTTLWNFSGADGIYPLGALISDTAGNLYGSTNEGGLLSACAPGGGVPPGCGVVYELSPPANGGTTWTRKLVWRYTGGPDGLYPAAGPVARLGTLYATSGGGDLKGFGSITKMVPPGGARKAWSITSAFTFANDANGAQPEDALLLRGGVFYGTTLGHDGPAPARYGTVFSITP